jgi:hypothetical protein
MRPYLLFFLLVVLMIVLFQPKDYGPETIVAECGGADDLCGYVWRKSRKEVIPRRYERAMPFREGLAAVRIDGRFGYIDENGEIVIEPAFDLAGAFDQGLAEVLVGKHTGVINRKGEVVVAPRFARSIPFTEDVVLVRKGEWADKKAPGEAVLDKNEFWLVKGQMGLYGVEGQQKEGWITKPRFTFRFFAHNGQGDGLIWAHKSGKRGALYGLMRADGSWQVEPTYTTVRHLRDGRAVVRKGPWPSKEEYRAAGTKIHLMSGYAGAVDENGVLVIPTEYESLTFFNTRGYGLVQQGEQYGFLDRSGRLLAGRYFDEVESPTDRHPPRGRLNEVWYDLESEDGLSTSSTQSRMTTTTTELVAASPVNTDPDSRRKKGPPSGSLDCPGGNKIYRDGKFWGLKDSSGQVIVAAEFQAIDCLYEKRAWAAIESEQRWCQIGPDGARLEQSECRAVYYPLQVPQHTFERFDPAPYTNSVLWMRAFLEHGENSRKPAPRVIGKGYDGSTLKIEIRCRFGTRCD